MNIKALITTSACGLLMAALPAQAGVHGSGYGQKPVQITQPAQSACAAHTYCVPQKKWVPAHYEQVQKHVWIPGHTKTVWVQPVYKKSCGLFGMTYQVLISGGHFATQKTPGHNEIVTQNVFVAGKWEATCKVIAAPHHSGLNASLRAQYSAFHKPSQLGTKFKGYNGYGKQSGAHIGGYFGNPGKGSYGGFASKKKGAASW